MKYAKNLFLFALIAMVSTGLYAASLPAAVATEARQADNFLDELAARTYAYLSSDWATSNHLPWSWRSYDVEGGDYANTTEIGLLMLSHLGAYEMKRDWSPDWVTVETELMAVLGQLRAWQTGAQSYQPFGPNAFENSVFYQWYWISWDSSVVGEGNHNHVVPSIDNAFLAASLMVIRAYGSIHNYTALSDSADAILQDIDFSLWYDNQLHRFNWGGAHDPLGGIWADYWSNENRLINFIARALGHLSPDEFRASLAALVQLPGTYDRGTSQVSDDITVQAVAWDGSYFTYMAPGLFIQELDTVYGEETILPATWAQIAYASDQGYSAWGLSDSSDVGDGAYVQQGAPPAPGGNPETRPGLVAPHASAMALVTPYAVQAQNNLMRIADTFPASYDAQFGFRDSVMADSNSLQYGEVSVNWGTLGQEWLFLSLVNAETGFIWRYFYCADGVVTAHEEMYGDSGIRIACDVEGVH